MFANLGTAEIIIIAVVIFILFGGNKLPEFAKGVKEAKKEFKKAYEESEKSDSSKK